MNSRFVQILKKYICPVDRPELEGRFAILEMAEGRFGVGFKLALSSLSLPFDVLFFNWHTLLEDGGNMYQIVG